MKPMEIRIPYKILSGLVSNVDYRERTAYLIIDKDCGNAYAFSEILNTYKPRVPTDSEIRLGILSSILKTHILSFICVFSIYPFLN